MHVFHTPLSLLHDPPTEILSGRPIKPYESPARVGRILSALLPDDPEPLFTEQACHWDSDEVLQDKDLLDAIKQVHGPGYLDFLKTVYDQWCKEGGSKDAVLPETFLRSDMLLEPDRGPARELSAIEQAGRYSFDLSAPITKDTWVSALASCRIALRAVDFLIDSLAEKAVFALCRPPGHHAAPGLCGGYCYLSNVAIAARRLQRHHGQNKIAILDVDYHHGNGTSRAFYDDPSVLYVSLHGLDYPYFTGAQSERGSGPGFGANLNYPLPLGTDGDTYCRTLDMALAHIQTFKPDFLLVSLGVDTHVDDPITDFKLTLPSFSRIGGLIRSRLPNVPTCFVMEGGYSDAIGECVRRVLLGHKGYLVPMPQPKPDAGMNPSEKKRRLDGDRP